MDGVKAVGRDGEGAWGGGGRNGGRGGLVEGGGPRSGRPTHYSSGLGLFGGGWGCWVGADSPP